jgi:hypothetical protein
MELIRHSTPHNVTKFCATSKTVQLYKLIVVIKSAFTVVTRQFFVQCAVLGENYEVLLGHVITVMLRQY